MTKAYRSAFWVVALAAFFVNPFFACVAEDEFQYGAPEMRAAVEGTWDLTLSFSDGETQTVTLAIAQGSSAPGAQSSRGSGRGLVREAAACGTRTLVKSAGACSSSSEMPLAVSFLSGEDALRTATMSGNLVVHSLIFTQGNLLLRVGDIGIDGTLSSAGVASNLTIRPIGEGRTGSATLVRTSP
jgi:hypothetical protein